MKNSNSISLEMLYVVFYTIDPAMQPPRNSMGDTYINCLNCMAHSQLLKEDIQIPVALILTSANYVSNDALSIIWMTLKLSIFHQYCFLIRLLASDKHFQKHVLSIQT